MIELRGAPQPVSDVSPTRLGRRGLWFVSVPAVLAVGLLGWVLWNLWYQSNLAEAQRAVAAGRFAAARVRLVRLAAWWPSRGEVEMLLGDCEHGTGRTDA